MKSKLDKKVELEKACIELVSRDLRVTNSLEYAYYSKMYPIFSSTPYEEFKVMYFKVKKAIAKRNSNYSENKGPVFTMRSCDE